MAVAARLLGPVHADRRGDRRPRRRLLRRRVAARLDRADGRRPPGASSPSPSPSPFVVGPVAWSSTRTVVDPDRVMVGEPAGAVLSVAQPGPTADAVDRRRRARSAARSCPSPCRRWRPAATTRRCTNCRPTVGPRCRSARPRWSAPTRSGCCAGRSARPRRPRCGSTRGGRSSAPLPSGFAKDLEGPTSDASPAGDIAFHALRPYQLGDDRRHIHWMSTARTGTLMVRHYVDNRRPTLGVLLDDAIAPYDDDMFEVAVEIATSLLVSSLLHQLPVTGRTTTEWLAGRLRPVGRDSLLEHLTAGRAQRPRGRARRGGRRADPRRDVDVGDRHRHRRAAGDRAAGTVALPAQARPGDRDRRRRRRRPRPARRRAAWRARVLHTCRTSTGSARRGSRWRRERPCSGGRRTGREWRCQRDRGGAAVDRARAHRRAVGGRHARTAQPHRRLVVPRPRHDRGDRRGGGRRGKSPVRLARRREPRRVGGRVRDRRRRWSSASCRRRARSSTSSRGSRSRGPTCCRRSPRPI